MTAASTDAIDLIATSSTVQPFTESNCYKNTASPCQVFNKSSIQCFGSSLQFESTSFELVSDAKNFKEANDKLLLWSGN